MSQRLVTEIHRGLCSNPQAGGGGGGRGLSLSYSHFTIFVVVVAFWLFLAVVVVCLCRCANVYHFRVTCIAFSMPTLKYTKRQADIIAIGSENLSRSHFSF